MLTKLSKSLYGMTQQEALSTNTCISCKESVLSPCGTEWNKDLFYSPEGQREYTISALCEKCFDQITSE